MRKTISFLYGVINYVIFLGVFLSAIAFWATPEMTAGHLVFAIATTAYVFIAMVLEGRDLIPQFGKRYRRCRARVLMDDGSGSETRHGAGRSSGVIEHGHVRPPRRAADSAPQAV